MYVARPFRIISYLISSHLVTLMIGLALQVVIARLLLPEGRGEYAICIMFTYMISVFTFFGNEYSIRHMLLKSRCNIHNAFSYLLTCLLYTSDAADE